MDHTKQYNLLICKARNRGLAADTYYEKHHVVPKSLGGSNSKSNLVYLTGREHFVAHMLLAHMYGGGMWAAAAMMKASRKVQSRELNSRLYEIARRNWSQFLQGKQRPAHVIEALKKHATNRVVSDETKAKMSLVRKGKPRSGDPSKWKHSDEAKQKMRESHIRANTGARLPRMYGDDNPMKRPENQEKISKAKKAYWAALREKQLLLSKENQ
jgi:hypothetical protein